MTGAILMASGRVPTVQIIFIFIVFPMQKLLNWVEPTLFVGANESV
jgi:hypothetical protein